MRALATRCVVLLLQTHFVEQLHALLHKDMHVLKCGNESRSEARRKKLATNRTGVPVYMVRAEVGTTPERWPNKRLLLEPNTRSTTKATVACEEGVWTVD
jgi:hypothetical protein